MSIRGKQGESLAKFHDLIKKYNDLLTKINASELVRALVDETEILKYYKRQDTIQDQEHYANVMEVLNTVDDFMERNPGSLLHDFL